MAIYNDQGVEVSTEHVANFLADWPEFYTDNAQASEATRSDMSDAILQARIDTATAVQDFIDADPKLADALIVAEADDISHYYVKIQFNAGVLAESSERGIACRGALGLITGPGVGGPPREAVGQLGFRCSSDQAISHLTYLSALLPVPA